MSSVGARIRSARKFQQTARSTSNLARIAKGYIRNQTKDSNDRQDAGPKIKVSYGFAFRVEPPHNGADVVKS
jgi:hypothetical protein